MNISKVKSLARSALFGAGFSFFGMLPMASAQTPAAEPVAPDAVIQLEAILQQTTSLKADVDQLLIDQDGRELQQTRARLVMHKPSSFYWEITEPYSEVMVTDGKLIWRYEPDLEQVTIQHFNEELDRTPVMLLNGDAQSIAETYEVTAVMGSDNAITRFVLAPRQPDSLFERLSIAFRGAELVEMQFEDSLGQKTSLSITVLERNQEIPAAQFTFTPPDGVEIIDTVSDTMPVPTPDPGSAEQ
jgi:outer membrane lipoprotein carrier protein